MTSGKTTKKYLKLTTLENWKRDTCFFFFFPPFFSAFVLGNGGHHGVHVFLISNICSLSCTSWIHSHYLHFPLVWHGVCLRMGRHGVLSMVTSQKEGSRRVRTCLEHRLAYHTLPKSAGIVSIFPQP